jgi:hypothetical protein
MLSSKSYLIPQTTDVNGVNTLLLNSLVQQLMQAHRSATESANTLLSDPRLHYAQLNVLIRERALTIAHAKFYTTGSGFGVANCAFLSLANVCKHVLSVCHNKLLPLAQMPRDEQALKEFHSCLAQLKETCCTNDPNSNNLMWSVQTLMPSLAKLSGQIDNDALGKQASIAQVPPVEALPHLTQLSQIKKFNSQVNQVLTLSQSILNVMSEWQDRLDVLIEMPSQSVSLNFYENQVQTATLYWQSIQTTINQYLENQIKHDKPKPTHPVKLHAKFQPQRFPAWRPKFTYSASESWA